MGVLRDCLIKRIFAAQNICAFIRREYIIPSIKNSQSLAGHAAREYCACQTKTIQKSNGSY